MAKKRKSDNQGLDEVDRTLYTSFCTAANSISQLYTQAQNQQKVAFQAGERHSLEKFYQWLLREQQMRSNISTEEILRFLQKELDAVTADELPTAPVPQFQHPYQQQQQQQQQQPPAFLGHQMAGTVGYPGQAHSPRVGFSTDQGGALYGNDLTMQHQQRPGPPFGSSQRLGPPFGNNETSMNMQSGESGDMYR